MNSQMFYKKKKNNKEHYGFWQRCQITVIAIPEDKFVLVVEFYASLILLNSQKSPVFSLKFGHQIIFSFRHMKHEQISQTVFMCIYLIGCLCST